MYTDIMLKLKLAAVTVILALLPFADSFACSCDKDDFFTVPVTVEEDSEN